MHGELNRERTLERVCATAGYPKTIRVDFGGDFITWDLDLRSCSHDVTRDVSWAGNPTDRAIPAPSVRTVKFQRPAVLVWG